MSAHPIWQGSLENKLIRFLITPFLSILFAITYVLNDTAKPEKQIVGWGWLYFSLVLVIAFVAVMTFTKLNVEVREDGFYIRYGYWIYPVQKIDWQNVASVRTLHVEPVQWGGWGYRWVPWKKATAAVMRRGPGLRFDFANGKVFVITIDDAQTALAAIRSVLDRMPPA
ncbi:MAG: hypothetical protein RJA41_985 [Actinomycetota bacterium]